MHTSSSTHSNHANTNMGVPPIPPEAHQQAATANVEAPTTGYIPLNQLRRGPNVRSTTPLANIPELAELIYAQGLLQALGVIVEPEFPDFYSVVFGGRRLAALELLATQGRIAVDELIECKLFAADRATQISLTENSGREGMHPADQVEAFRYLVEWEGLSVPEVSSRFGVSELVVRRRLKLAHIAPQLLNLYRAQPPEINEQQLMALTLTDDQALQVQVWESLSHWNNGAATIKAQLTNDELPSTHPLVRFVGWGKYRTNGGKYRSDLFATADGESCYVSDISLLHRIADEQLSKACEELNTEGWAWVIPASNSATLNLHQYSRVKPTTRKLTDKEASALQEAEEAADKAEKAYFACESEAEGEDELQQASEAADEHFQALSESFKEFSLKQKKNAGVIVTIGSDGGVRIERGLMRQEDVKAAMKSDANKSSDSGTDENEGEPFAHTNLTEKAARTAGDEVSEKLMQDLTAHRTAAMQAALIGNPKVAMVTLLDTLARRVFHFGYHNTAVKLSIETCDREIWQCATGLETSPAGAALRAADAEWAHVAELASGEAKDDAGEPASLFSWLIGQSDDVHMHLLAYLVARTTNVTQQKNNRRDPGNEIAAHLSLDMRECWTATAQTYFLHVSKDACVAVVTDVAGAAAAAPLPKLKKAEVAEAAEGSVDGKGWLPLPLRRAA
jgi:ParB family chromosome partitioning protein